MTDRIDILDRLRNEEWVSHYEAANEIERLRTAGDRLADCLLEWSALSRRIGWTDDGDDAQALDAWREVRGNQ